MLPERGTYEALESIRVAKEALSFSPDELEILNLRNEGNRVVWDNEKANQVVKDVPLDKYITGLLRTKIAELQENEELTEQTRSLYEKFILMYK